MTEFHSEILAVHVTAALLSGALFALRGLAALAGSRLPMAAPVRRVSYAIDTVLLAAALMLVAILPRGVFASHWLTVKLVLVVTYIVLGVLALRPARSRRSRALCYVAALAVFILIVGIARAHDPLGWLAWTGR